MTTQVSNNSSHTQSRHTDDASFAADVAAAPWVLVKFTGKWCGPCRALQPTLEAIARGRDDLLVLSLDVDDNQEVTQQYEVRSVPTLLVFRDGRPIGRMVGNQPRARIEALLRT